MFPKKAIASVTGIGCLAGGIGGVLVQLFAGFITDLYAATPTVAYGIMFGVCAFAYYCMGYHENSCSSIQDYH